MIASVDGNSDGNCIHRHFADYADLSLLPEVLFQGSDSWWREGLKIQHEKDNNCSGNGQMIKNNKGGFV